MARDETILVTGVSGFVGAAVARVMAAEGWRVRGLARSTSPATNLQNFPGEIVRGDMLDRASIERALEGCTALAHVAADYRLWAPDPEEIVRHNREGTRAVMEAALAAGVKRIVYTSSVATIAPLDGGAAGEDRPLTEQTAIGAYKRSKVVAERLVERMVAEQGLPAVIVNPSTPIGPRDVKPTPTGRILVEAATGKIPAFVDTGLNLVHVDDVARGHLLALTKGVPGRRYILGGEDVSLQEMLAEVAHLVGRKPPTIRLPRLPLMPLAVVSEAWGRMTGREPMLTRDALRMAKYRMFFSSERAKAELGYTARPWREAVADAIGWFRQEGMIG
ncbi:hopanoid-associated sugar epimerase [Sphingomonas oligoaromativorans]|uniref:hopanoid-associated sugar epimerase n=1 Tax=Sphingomonas oligoaromativorans TaxID=575322 RepID=UPI0014247031|nr:hopanoid-associated sugar epimerase [Sphingomonas oligoaromativorans]NIJ33124.1 hopanoid-associated sugar epimerase [Sphingomonas oligoaromativorans]